MKSVIEILNELESDNSRLFKVDVLEQNLDNKLLERVLKATLDPYTQYYIRKIPDYDRGDKEFRNPLEWALDNLDKLSSRELTGNIAKQHLVDILENLTASDADVIERVIGGDLRCVEWCTTDEQYSYQQKYTTQIHTQIHKEEHKTRRLVGTGFSGDL